MTILKEEILSNVKSVVEREGRKLKSLIIFGSSVYRPREARDLDMLVIVDRVIDVYDKIDLEVKITRTLGKLVPKTILDVVVFDEESFIENMEPGGLASGLVAGCKIIYDELGLENCIRRIMEKLFLEEYVILKNRRKINLSLLAKARLKLLD